MRSIHLENVHHCLPTTRSRNYCGLRTKLFCSVSKFVLSLVKRVKNNNNKEPGTNYLKLVENQDTLTDPHSQLLPDLKGYIVTIPTERNSSQHRQEFYGKWPALGEENATPVSVSAFTYVCKLILTCHHAAGISAKCHRSQYIVTLQKS